MKHTRLFLSVLFPAVLAMAAAVFSSCSTVPMTGRQQLSLIPDSQILSMSYTEYDQFLKEHKLSADPTATAMVKRVGSRIRAAVEKYFEGKGQQELIADYRWEFNLIEDAQVNAWCMPGGKVVIYTGILPVTQSETGLAVVMGHEIAHAIAEHGNERMSQGLLAQFGGVALDAALSEKPDQTRQLWVGAFGLGTQVGVLLPFSRLQESEADELGLTFMAMAGYDPNEAVAFWERMAAKKDGSAPPEFLSTHPSDATRISDIKKQIPKAMKYYKP